MASSTVTAPELTQEQVQRILVKPLEAASVFLAAGPRIFDVTAAGVVRIPKLVSMTAPAWHGENELITEVDPDCGEVVLLDGVKRITRFSAPEVLLAGRHDGHVGPRCAEPDDERTTQVCEACWGRDYGCVPTRASAAGSCLTPKLSPANESLHQTRHGTEPPNRGHSPTVNQPLRAWWRGRGRDSRARRLQVVERPLTGLESDGPVRALSAQKLGVGDGGGLGRCQGSLSRVDPLALGPVEDAVEHGAEDGSLVPADTGRRPDVRNWSLEDVAESVAPRRCGCPAPIRENRARPDVAAPEDHVFDELVERVGRSLIIAGEGWALCVIPVSHDMQDGRRRCEGHADGQLVTGADELDLHDRARRSGVDAPKRRLHERHGGVEPVVQSNVHQADDARPHGLTDDCLVRDGPCGHEPLTALS